MKDPSKPEKEAVFIGKAGRWTEQSSDSIATEVHPQMTADGCRLTG